MATEDFVHLHVHTDYSMLDGAAKVKNLVAEAKRLGQSAIAITDHGYLFGAYEFYSECKKADIKPIVGLEAYVTPGTSRFDKTRVQWGTEAQQAAGLDVSARGSYTHLTLLSRTTQGMHNLFRLGSYGSIDGQMGKWPRIDRELISRYSEGLIATTGCPSGEVQRRLLLGQFDEAYRAAGEFQDIFGKENYFVELMDHGIDIERRVRGDLLELSKKIGAPLLATNDSHYVRKEDQRFQDALLCINSGTRIDDEGRFKFDGADYYLRPAAEMRQLFRDVPEACDNTLLVAEMCDVSFRTTGEGANYMPEFPVPDGESMESWFVKEVERGANKRFPGGVPDAEREQIEYETGVITEMGFPGYFLVVADFINWAKDNGIRVGPGRGSGAGSIVAYCLGITDLNPLEHGLMFERFLNPERVSMPDIDVDFDERRRGEVIDYVSRKYGHEKVSQVITYGTIKTKQALKDSARILGKPFVVGEKLTKELPPTIMGKDISVSGIFNPEDPRYGEAKPFRDLIESDKPGSNDYWGFQDVVDMALGIEGLTRQWGVHACAVIMSSHRLTDIIPMMKRLQDGAIITQFDYPTCETLGLLKMDFLGLRNLTVISDAMENIVRNGKEEFVLENVPLDDKATYELLGRADTLGVFQLDGGGMRNLLRLMKPTCFADISAVGALYRPGPMGAGSHTNYALRKNGQQRIEPIHPELEEPLRDVLAETHGLIVYQEQVMKIAQVLAGFSLGQADILRKAMGKKKADVLAQQFEGFRAGMLQNGYSDDAITTLWEILVPFASYAFNKSHSAAYGLVSYWTAYLKANYPVEYMAALLTSTKGNKDKLALYLGECRHLGIKVLPPDVNDSVANFTPVGQAIRFGLAGIRNVGEPVVNGIIEAREERGRFTSFTDFLNKVPQQVCNKRTIDSLIKGGAFDDLGHTRRALQLRHEEAIDAVIDVKRNEAIGQFDLFAGALGDGAGNDFAVEIPDLPEWDRKDKLSFEREMLGLYVSDHPLAGHEAGLAKNADMAIAALKEDETRPDRSRVTISGLITGVQRRTTKTGNLWAIVTVEDLSGSIDCQFFPSTYQTVSERLQADAIVAVTGRLSRRDGGVEISAESMKLLELQMEADAPVGVTLQMNRCTRSLMQSLREVLVAHPGSSPMRLHLQQPGRTVVTQCPEDLWVTPDASLFAELKSLLGPNCLVN
ncbi:MAG: DNA polymerase III subunit alpha [Actinomycetaceae bacterium]|nr:DNA polymerase III subunit alpha [Actinomycetaceae bacterium]